MICDRCTYDQPHTHDNREWIEGDWDTLKSGTNARFQHPNGLSIISGQIDSHLRIWSNDISRLRAIGFKVFVEAPPTPQPIELPNEAGIYVTRGEQEWNKTPLFKVAGGWQFANGQDATETARMWHTDAGLVRLEPRNETAKAVLEAIKQEYGENFLDNPDSGWNRIASKFGVTVA